MEYSELYVKRILELCNKKGYSVNKLALALNMTFAEFLDFEEMNIYSFD